MKRTLTATVVLAAGVAALSLGCQKKEPAAGEKKTAESEKKESAAAEKKPVAGDKKPASPSSRTHGKSETKKKR